MADYNLVDPQSGWEYDLHSIYSAYIGHFQHHGVDWWNKPWGAQFFMTFDQFLEFGWPVVVITDVYPPYDAHIVTTAKHIQAFLKMMRTRFGEDLALVKSITKVQPFEARPRPMRHVDDISSYKKIFATLPGAALSARKERIRSGDPPTIRELWNSKNKNFLAIDFEWSEKSSSTCLEFGYAALRSQYVASSGTWPAIPEDNYRLGHFVVSELVDVVINKRFPTYPRSYSFGRTQFVPKKQLAGIIQTIVDSLASPDSDTQENDMVLVAHGISGDLERLSELKIRIPSNTIIIDTTAFERQLFRIGERPGSIIDPHTSLSRQTGSALSLANLLRSLGVDASQIVFHNSGNDAFAALVSLQLLLEPDTKLRKLKRASDGPIPLPPSCVPASSPRATAVEPPGTVHQSGIAMVSPTSPTEDIPVATTKVHLKDPPVEADKVPDVTASARGQGQRRGRGRGGVKRASGQQQQRDAKVENAMANLEL